MKTLEEIEELKRQWEADPCWDIEDTDGFEAHYGELIVYRGKKQVEWKEQAKQKIKDKADSLGCPGNLNLAKYVMSLEDRLESLEKRLEKLENA